MARRGALTALQAVLAGISGGAGGYIQQEETKRKRLTEEQERERRKALDIADLQERNYTSPEQLAQSREKAAPATSRVARSAIMSALSPMAPAPMPSTADIATVMETASLRQPLSSEQRLSMYGQEFVRPESSLATTQREKSMDRANRMFESAAERRTRQEEMTYQRGRDKAADELAGKRHGLEEKKYGLEERRVAAAEKAAVQKQSDADWRRNKLPAAAQAKLSGLESGLIMAADLRNQISGNEEALGLKNLMWGQVINRLDPEGVGVRASIEALTGEIRYQRFAGALTATEVKFAERFLPDARDRADAALAKLSALEKFLDQKRKGIYDTYGGQFTSARSGSAANELDAMASGRNP
jgi:hypothetical protein